MPKIIFLGVSGVLVMAAFWAGRASVGNQKANAFTDTQSGKTTQRPLIRHTQSVISVEQLIQQRLSENDPQSQKETFLEILASLTPENAPLYADAILANGITTIHSRHELALFLHAWGAIAGKDALAYALDHDILKESGILETIAGNIVEGWSSADRVSLMSEAIGSENEKIRLLLQKLVAEDLLRRKGDFDQTADWIAKIDPSLQQRFTKDLVKIRLNEDVEGGLNWASSLKSPTMKEIALERAAAKYFEKDFSEAVAWASGLPATKEHQQAVARVAEEWAEKDPAASASWVANLPDGEPRNFSLGKVIREWSRRDFVKAGEWLNTLEKGRFRDQGVTQYVRDVFSREPSVSLEWALSISDAELQTNLSELAFKKWAKRDPQEALKWAESSGQDWTHLVDPD